MTNVRKTTDCRRVFQQEQTRRSAPKYSENTGNTSDFVSAQIEMVPQNYQGLSEEQGVMMQKLIDAMEDDDDVQNVWHNWEE